VPHGLLRYGGEILTATTRKLGGTPSTRSSQKNGPHGKLTDRIDH